MTFVHILAGGAFWWWFGPQQGCGWPRRNATSEVADYTDHRQSSARPHGQS